MSNFIDPDAIAEDQKTAATLRQVAALAGDFYTALRSVQIPDELAFVIVQDWHYNYITEGMGWEEDEV